MNPGDLIAPGLIAALAAFFPDACTVQEATYATGATGTKTATWATLSGHADLACRVAPINTNAAEYQRLASLDLTRAHRLIALAYHPDIVPGMRVLVGATTYSVLTTRHDGQGTITELLCEEVTVG